MSSITTAAIIMGGLGLLFGVILAVADRFLRVDEDPRVERVEKMLPGSNCGACGEPGCRSFAEKLVSGALSPSRCTVSNTETHEAIAELLGVDAGEEQKRVARLHCAGGLHRARQLAEYRGHEGCRAAAVVAGGGKTCQWGCLGLADCEVACTFDAIRMSEEALPVVNVELCTACGDCVDACPRDLFEILPVQQHLLVQCRTPLLGDEARALCDVACDACGRCAQDAAAGLIEMQNNLPMIDYARGGPASPEATYRCPTGAIQWVTKEQFVEQRRRLRVYRGHDA